MKDEILKETVPVMLVVDVLIHFVTTLILGNLYNAYRAKGNVIQMCGLWSMSIAQPYFIHSYFSSIGTFRILLEKPEGQFKCSYDN